MRPRHALVAVALACGGALAAGLELMEGGDPAARPAVLLGVAEDGKLVRVAPVSLRPLPGRGLRMEGPPGAWALSPD
ncbi:MAG TPA: hypothetical protein VNO82_11830, partial [Solirubrobacteraceae bacterium]|nr:hypothetical protein [Solirubrobacteraceae bacterium]